ncbi:MAG: hypothetical protein ACK5LN_01905 [Propioniciclava sp.]
MKPRVDATALVIGLMALLIASITLWSSFGSVSWAGLGALIPILLVAFGLLGLFVSRPKP